MPINIKLSSAIPRSAPLTLGNAIINRNNEKRASKKIILLLNKSQIIELIRKDLNNMITSVISNLNFAVKQIILNNEEKSFEYLNELFIYSLLNFICIYLRGIKVMARICVICGKKPISGNTQTPLQKSITKTRGDPHVFLKFTYVVTLHNISHT